MLVALACVPWLIALLDGAFSLNLFLHPYSFAYAEAGALSLSFHRLLFLSFLSA
jgi:hypothetical protein